MSEPFLGEIRLVAFTYAPRGWAQCNGQLLPISQNQALFSILGTTYGGDGRVNFALPDFRGRMPLHANGQFPQGGTGGEEAHSLAMGEMPAHTHAIAASSNAADQVRPASHYWANGGEPAYAATPDVTLAPQAATTAGSGQGHENRPPLQVLNFIIALQGIFPSRS